MKLPYLQVLSDAEIQAIHQASLSILEQTGLRMGSDKMCKFMEKKGLKVGGDGIVKFPARVLQQALSHIPKTFDMYNRCGEKAFTIGDGEPKIAAGHNAVFWLDSQSGLTRPSTVEDVRRFVQLCEKLDMIDMVGIPVMPQDVPEPRRSLVYAVEAAVSATTKPIFFSTDNADVNRRCIEVLAGVFPSDLAEKPYGISQLSPTSPLFWEENVLEALTETVDAGVPLAILPEPMAGLSAPYTLAGLLTVNNVECLSGLVMAQLIRPGAKVLYANSWTTVDMKTGNALVGSVETSLCRIAGAQLAKYYHVPCHTTAPNSDNHAHDEQNAWEKCLSLIAAVGAGNDVIVNCGMFAAGMTCSDEQLLMDAQMAAMLKRFAQGINVTEQTIALDLIKQVGVQGDYMMTDHTLQWLKSDEYVSTPLSVNGSYQTWQNAGAPDTVAMAKKLKAKLLE